MATSDRRGHGEGSSYWDEDDALLGAYVILSLTTGIRTEEARALRWDHVNLHGRPGQAQSADLERDLASGVPGSNPRQRLAGLVEGQYRFGLRAEFAGIDKGGQLLKPRPAAAGSE